MKSILQNSSNNIKFISSGIDTGTTFSPPVPSLSVIPDWYKRQTSGDTPQNINLGDSGNPRRTIKSCMPVFDVVTAGYMVLCPADIYIDASDPNNVTSGWSTDISQLIDTHSPWQYSEYSVPEGYSPVALKFNNTWKIKTPPGYSTLFIQPSLRDDLPFQVVPAIVDTDKFPISVNFPFFIKNYFKGIIEMDTPIIQIIPFKRDEWKHEVIISGDSGDLEWQTAKRKIFNRYKSFYRSPKSWR
jgi:hypothetical protein